MPGRGLKRRNQVKKKLIGICDDDMTSKAMGESLKRLTSFSPSRQSLRAQGLPPTSRVPNSSTANSIGRFRALSSSYKLNRNALLYTKGLVGSNDSRTVVAGIEGDKMEENERVVFEAVVDISR